MKFWDREKEKEWLKRYLQTEPNAILFVYGPKSSGKSTLLRQVLDELMVDEGFSFQHCVYWFDLRGKLVASYKDVIEIFFIDEEAYTSLKEGSRRVEAGFAPFFKVSIESKKLMEERRLDPFVYMEEVLKEEGKKGVIVFDELQKLKDVYLSGDSKQRPLVKELFNFFVRLTKVLHLAHVIVMTSDTFFIEQVYTDSTLANTSRFYLVDFFDDETAVKILMGEGVDEGTAKEIVEQAGGVPWILEEVLEGDKEILKRISEEVKGSIRETFGNIYERDPRELEELLELLRRFLEGKEIEVMGKDRKAVKKLVEAEVLFYDPVEGRLRFQSGLHERAARELLGVE